MTANQIELSINCIWHMSIANLRFSPQRKIISPECVFWFEHTGMMSVYCSYSRDLHIYTIHSPQNGAKSRQNLLFLDT